MNNIYVDELPESCLDCEFCGKRNYCCILIQKDVREYRDECPLALLSDRLAKNEMRFYIQLTQNLSSRWQKLKDFIKKQQGYTSFYETNIIEALDDVLDKMQELEGDEPVNVVKVDKEIKISPVVDEKDIYKSIAKDLDKRILKDISKVFEKYGINLDEDRFMQIVKEYQLKV